MDLTQITRRLIQFAVAALLFNICILSMPAQAASGASPFLEEEQAKSFLTQPTSRQNRILSSVLGTRSDVGHGWEEIRELESKSSRSSQIERLESAVLRSGLPLGEKSAILNKLAMGSLIGIGNLAESLLISRSKGLNRQNSLA